MWKTYEELTPWELLELRYGWLGYQKVMKDKNGKYITYYKVDE